jgi:hypothetical protein
MLRVFFHLDTPRTHKYVTVQEIKQGWAFMKKCIAYVLMFSMLSGLCACGDQAASAVSPSPSEDPTDKLMEAATGYTPVEVDVEWTETTLDTDKTGYLLQETDFSTLFLDTDSPGFYTDSVDLTDQT